MNQLLKRRGEAEHAIKDLESLYTETVVKSISHVPFLKLTRFTDLTLICVSIVP